MAIFYLQLAVLAICARLAGELAHRIRLPVVIGEVITGVFLGPTVLRQLFPDIEATLFPMGGQNHIALSAITSLGVTLFLLAAGLELDLKLARRQFQLSWPISLAGIAVPVIVGFLPAYFFPDIMGFHPNSDRMVFAIFVGAALAITALPTTARILLDLDLYKTPFGMLIMSSALLDDFIGWILIGIVFALDNLKDTNSFTTAKIATMVGGTIAFVAILLTIGRWLCKFVIAFLYRTCSQRGGIIGFILGLGMLGASITQALGIHGLFGAFMVGVVVGSTELKKETREGIEHFVSSFLAPLFFASVGLTTNFVAHFSWLTVSIVIVSACIGKIVGCFLAARAERMSVATAFAAGIAMNGRGGMEIILGLMALQEQIIDERMFVALAIMAVVTSAISGRVLESMAPLLRTMDTAALTEADAQ